jgi:UDP-2,3-diacylglucosamine pyrophosphatase LpxH
MSRTSIELRAFFIPVKTTSRIKAYYCGRCVHASVSPFINMFAALGRWLKAHVVFLLKPPVQWFAKKISSSPDREAVFRRLSEMYRDITQNPDSREGSLYVMDLASSSFIIFSDIHKGNRGKRDEFRFSENNYLAALDYYDRKGARYINLGDSEEFWKFNIFSIMLHNQATFAAEKRFIRRNAFHKVYGNHDLFWEIDPFAKMYLWQVYGKPVRIYGGIVVRVPAGNGKHIDIFCTHGHQGDKRSDGNKFSIWFVAYVWGPLQSFLDININTPAVSKKEKTLHNRLMYEWSQEQENVVLVTGHTHQPIFHSYSHLQQLRAQLAEARAANDLNRIKELEARIERHPGQCTLGIEELPKYKPTYFNAGCCCYSDHSITGIEIADGFVRLVRWADGGEGPERQVLEELPLTELRAMFLDQ